MTDIKDFGWDDSYSRLFAPFEADGCIPGRVSVQRKTGYLVVSSHGELGCSIAGKLRFLAGGAKDFPVVGDWVALRARPGQHSGTIVGVLPRKSAFSRKAAGRETGEQIAAANIDVAFLVNGLDGNYDSRRLERYLVLAAASGTSSVIVLNKADLCPDLDAVLAEVSAIAGGKPVFVMTAARGEGVDAILRYLGPGKTGALLGSSGVGKSTIINCLLGRKKLRTGEVRAYDGKGRHTTAQRELVLLPAGGMLIDTPGMRELQLCEGEEGILDAFEDIEDLARTCRFRNCRHDQEPGCAVRKALEEETLDGRRLTNFLKLQREGEERARTYGTAAQAPEKEKVKRTAAKQKRGYRK